MKKISIITPVYNGEKTIEETIKSIISQEYENYEHIILDGGSSDSTLDVIKKYKNQYNVKLISEKDNGMYDAIKKGFSIADGEIFAWLNADDIYMPWAFRVMNEVMNDEKVKWCTGYPNILYDECGVVPYNISCYSRNNIRNGYHDGVFLPFIQQESTFWRRYLWEKIDSDMFSEYKLAGDFWLWKEFAKYEEMYKVNSVISAFRVSENQMSADKKKYYAEIDSMKLNHPLKIKRKIVKVYDVVQSHMKPQDRLYLEKNN